MPKNDLFAQFDQENTLVKSGGPERPCSRSYEHDKVPKRPFLVASPTLWAS